MARGKKNSRNCIICKTAFEVKAISKNRVSPRKTCSDPCHRIYIAQRRQQWSAVDLEIINSVAESLPSARMVQAFNTIAVSRNRPTRSPTAIRLKVDELGYSLTPQFNFLTPGEIARRLGISNDAVVHWTKIGLKFHRHSSLPGSVRYIKTRDLRDFARLHPNFFGGIKYIDLFLVLEDEKLTEFITTNFPNRNRGITPPQRVKCVETGQVFDSYKEAGRAVFVTRSGIYRAIQRGGTAGGFHFVKI